MGVGNLHIYVEVRNFGLQGDSGGKSKAALRRQERQPRHSATDEARAAKEM